MKRYQSETFTDQIFEKQDFEEVLFEDCEFTDCTFKDCKFKEATFKSCRLSGVVFSHSDLGLVRLPFTRVREVVLEDCRATGINFTALALPEIRLNAPVDFYRTDISHSTFMGLALSEINIESCRAHEADFRECDLSHANLTETDFRGAQFGKANLKRANLSGAFDYFLDPRECKLEKAIFSFPEALGLLAPFDIVIEGYGDSE